MVEKSGGVVDGDGIAIMEFIIWAFFLFYYVANGGPLSPINGATTAQTNLGLAYTDLKWFMYVLLPALGYLFIKGWSKQEDKSREENA